MKKTSKACFVLAIIILSLSVISIAASCLSGPVHYRQNFGFYSIQYTGFGTLAGIRPLILGCTGIISGLLLFILSAILCPCRSNPGCDTPRPAPAPAPEADVQPKTEPVQAETKPQDQNT